MEFVKEILEIVFREALSVLPWSAWVSIGVSGLMGLFIALILSKGKVKPALWGSTISMLTMFFVVKGV